MKKLFVLAALFLTIDPIVDPVHADAAERDLNTHCRTPNIADGGLLLNVAADGKSAVLAEQSIMGPRNHKELVCVPGQIRAFPDALNNYLNCREQGAVDGGLMVRMFAGGIGGFHYASVREFSVIRGRVIEKEVEYGRLNCHVGSR